MATADFTWTIDDCLNEYATLPRDEYAIVECGSRVELTYWYAAIDTEHDNRTVYGSAISHRMSSPTKVDGLLRWLGDRYPGAYTNEVTCHFNRLRLADGERMKSVINGIA